jgi:flagellar biosynthesis/type III secretory pathway protein FliH
MEKKELRCLEKPLVLLLTDKRVLEFILDYKYSASWQEAKKCEAIMKMKEHIFYGVKEIVNELLDKAREEGYKKGYIDGQTEKTNKPKPVMSEFDKTSYLN